MIPVASLQNGTSLDASERVFTVTPQNIPIPNGSLRRDMRLQNMWHRASFVVIQWNPTTFINTTSTARNGTGGTGNVVATTSMNVNIDTDTNTEILYLVQKRSRFKDFGPGLLDGSPGGVLGYGESYMENATRELNEEMGIDVFNGNALGNRIKRLFEFSFQDERVKVFGECFLATYNGNLEELKLQEEEVEEVLVMKERDVVELIKNRPDEFIPDSLCAMKLFFKRNEKSC